MVVKCTSNLRDRKQLTTEIRYEDSSIASQDRLFAILAILLFQPSSVSAQVIVKQPPDLVAGEPYRLMFLTSEFRDGTSSDIEDYNEFVQGLADASPEIGAWDLEWKAIASTDEVDARDNTRTNPNVDLSVPIYGVHSAIFASSYDVFWDPGENSDQKFSMNVTELGTALTVIDPDDDALFAWTGTFVDGTTYRVPEGGTISGFLGSDRPGTGRAAGFSVELISAQLHDSNREFPLFAISEVITAVPEPNSGTAFVFLMLAVPVLLRRGRLRPSQIPIGD